MDKCELETQWKAYIERCFIDILNKPDNWCVLINPLNQVTKGYIKTESSLNGVLYIQIFVDTEYNDWRLAIIENHFDRIDIDISTHRFTGEKLIIYNYLYGT